MVKERNPIMSRLICAVSILFMAPLVVLHAAPNPSVRIVPGKKFLVAEILVQVRDQLLQLLPIAPALIEWGEGAEDIPVYSDAYA